MNILIYLCLHFLVCYSLWSCKVLDMTWRLNNTFPPGSKTLPCIPTFELFEGPTFSTLPSVFPSSPFQILSSLVGQPTRRLPAPWVLLGARKDSVHKPVSRRAQGEQGLDPTPRLVS